MAEKQRNLLDIRAVKAFMKNVPEDRKILADGLFVKLQYLTVLLANMEQELNTGIDVAFVRAYNETITRYGVICKQLAGLLPKAAEPVATDELLKFIAGDR